MNVVAGPVEGDELGHLLIDGKKDEDIADGQKDDVATAGDVANERYGAEGGGMSGLNDDDATKEIEQVDDNETDKIEDEDIDNVAIPDASTAGERKGNSTGSSDKIEMAASAATETKSVFVGVEWVIVEDDVGMAALIGDFEHGRLAGPVEKKVQDMADGIDSPSDAGHDEISERAEEFLGGGFDAGNGDVEHAGPEEQAEESSEQGEADTGIAAKERGFGKSGSAPEGDEDKKENNDAGKDTSFHNSTPLIVVW